MAKSSLERYKRQISLFNPEDIKNLTVAIVGVGAIGSCVAIELAKLGFMRFQLYDFDKIEEHNLSNQFFKNSQLGMLKTEATAELIREFGDKKLQVILGGKVTKDTLISAPIVVVCTDNMKVRKLVYRLAHISTDYFLDARMGGQVYRVYAVDMNNEEDKKFYEKTLYDDKNATDVPCTERSILFNIFGVASMVGNNLVKMLTKKPYKEEVCFDYINMMLVTSRQK